MKGLQGFFLFWLAWVWVCVWRVDSRLPAAEIFALGARFGFALLEHVFLLSRVWRLLHRYICCSYGC
uniref:Putative secreted protein n=1 Tax=Anopheles marajoara TaxID=58244 RepID=A0A2M4CFY6_9DIPT